MAHSAVMQLLLSLLPFLVCGIEQTEPGSFGPFFALHTCVLNWQNLKIILLYIFQLDQSGFVLVFVLYMGLMTITIFSFSSKTSLTQSSAKLRIFFPFLHGLKQNVSEYTLSTQS